jgi:oligopeptide transport system ATP-binding protein
MSVAEATGLGTTPLLEVKGLRMHFPVTEGVLIGRKVGEVKAVDGIDFVIRRGETLGLVGESGCGKTTTGRCILRLERPTAGEIRYDGVDIATFGGRRLLAFRRRIQVIFQDPYSSLNPRMKVGEIIAEPIRVHGIERDAARRDARVRELLSVCGLDPAFADRYPHEMSGGQRQRVGIARALALEPEFIVCDEAVSALDVSIQAQIINLLEDLREQFHLTYLFIAHDLSVPGEVPSPINPPSGCVFHPRCPIAVSECQRTRPELRELRRGHWVACSQVEPPPERKVIAENSAVRQSGKTTPAPT